MNRFNDAINQGKVKDFLLGKNEYFEYSREGYTGHSATETFEHLYDFGKYYGFKKLSEILQEEIKKIILTEPELSVWEFNLLLVYIYIYLYYQIEVVNVKKIDYPLKIEKELRKIINVKFNYFVNLYGLNKLYDQNKDLQDNNSFLLFNLKA